MKYLFFLNILSCLACLPNLCSAQNLISNGGFENYTSTPTSYSQWDRCVGWTNVNGVVGFNPGYGSPDYYHLQGANGAQMPNTFWATVTPHSGDGIMGCAGYYSLSQYREYISTPLTSTMQIGKEYLISFWMTNGSANWDNGASCNRLGIRFTTAPLTQLVGELIGGGVPPQVEIASVVWDTGWTQYTFSVIADSAYQHLTFGNFYTDAATTVVQQAPGAWGDAYYYLDDIEVVLGDTSGITIISDQTICRGDSVTLYVENIQAGVNYDWRSLSDLTVSLSTDSVLIVAPTDTTNYVVQVGSVPVYVTVNVIEPPTLDLGNDTTLCIGDQLLLDATIPNSSSYLWQDNSTGPTNLVTNTGLYHVQLTHYCGQFEDSIYVEFLAIPIVDLGADTSLCVGDQLLLDANFNSANYLWQDNSTGPTYLVTNAGLYHVQLTNPCGQSKDSIDVEFLDIPIVDLGADTSLCIGDQLLLDVSYHPASYLWQDNTTSPLYEIKQPGTYSVLLSNFCGTAIDEIIVDEDQCIVTIPTAFSPNGDGMNELFQPINLDKEDLIIFKIYNRWGQEVFDMNQQATIGWDGTFKGVAQPQEVYLYVLKYQRSKDTSAILLRGEVTLLR